MKNHSRILNIIKQILLGIFRTATMGFMGLLIGALIGGNLASPGTDIYFYYAGTYGYEAMGILGAQIGIGTGIILSAYLALRKKSSENIYSRILKVIQQIFFGFFGIVFLYFIGGLVSVMITTKLAINLTYAGAYGAQAAHVLGSRIGIALGIILSIFFIVRSLSSENG